MQKSILYIAPFFENNVLGESATAYVKALSTNYTVTCRAIGKKEKDNEIVSVLLKNKPCNNLIIHSTPDNFCFESKYNCIGITHIKTPLIQETNWMAKFSLMNHVFNDTSVDIPGIVNINPVFEKVEYIRKNSGNYRFLIMGEPASYEEIHTVVRAFCEEFRLEENVDLTIKVNNSVNVNDLRKAIMTWQSDIRKMNTPMYPAIHFNNSWMTRKKLLEFYTEFDCIVNTSLNNRWSRPIIDFGMVGGRCISLIDEPDLPTKHAYGISDNKDYPRGQSKTFPIDMVRRKLRENLNQKSSNYEELGYDLDSFTKIPKPLENVLI